MKALPALVVCLAMAATGAAADLRSYDLRVRVDGSGAATVDLVTRIDGAAADVVLIPVGFPEVTGLRLVDGPAGTEIAVQPAGRQTHLRASLPAGVAWPVVLSFSFRTGTLVSGGVSPGAPRMLRQAILNTQPDTIDAYSIQVVLPHGLRVHAVREALPKLRTTEAGPRVALARVEGDDTATLRGSALAQGDSASMQLELAPVARSPLWLLAGTLLSLLYLVSFRSLVADASPSETRNP